MNRTFRIALPVLLVFTFGCGGDDGSKSYPMNEFGMPDVPKEVVKTWPEKFCSVEIGMTKDEVRSIMGAPTQSYSDSSFNQDEWDGYSVGVTAFYDIDDRVEILADSIGTSGLPCEATRRRLAEP
jgi:hypothetical protein